MAEPAYTVASDSETTGGGGGDDRTPSSNFPDVTIGVDIGTSQCSVAVWNGSEVELLKNTRNQKIMRSYVTFKGDTPTGGVTEAGDGGNDDNSINNILSGSAVFNMKRLIGRADTDPVVVQSSKSVPFLVQTLRVGARPLVAALVNGACRATTPEEVLAIFLIEVRAMAELQLRRRVRSAVLTVPASFTRFQLTRVERACAMAGLHVLRLMPEPTAVALLYAQQQQQTAYDSMAGSGSEWIALIFNMGVGYTDVAVSATAAGVSQIRAVAGGAAGGEDLLQNTMRYLLPDADPLFPGHGVDEIKAMSRVRVATQAAIHELSVRTSALVDLRLGDGSNVTRVLERREFEEANKDVFESCAGLILRCLRDAKLEAEDVNDVIIVGGCSNIPRVKELVLSITKRKELYKGIDPLEAAVSGAALEAAVASGVSDPFGYLDLLTIQVTPLAIGIRADGGRFVPVIPRNTTMPANKDLTFTTAHDNQAEALIVVLESSDGERVEENHLIGYFKIVGIPEGPKGSPEISVCMDIDASNVLRVFAGVVQSGSFLPGRPFMEVRMPTLDDGHGWCAEALAQAYGSSLDLVTVKKSM